MAPFVSIIMSAYQAERYVSAALESALAQSYPHREIIVVNDGSTDGTPAILESFRRSHGIQVITQSNRGQCAALNEGFRRARGDLIKYFDSDDLISRDMVSLQVEALRDEPGKLAYGEWGRFYTDPAATDFSPHPGWHSGHAVDWLVSTWLDTEPMYQCALWLIPAELVRRAGGWDERLSLINDFEFFTRLVIASQGIVFTPGARLYYRSGIPGSLSDRKSRAAIESACLSIRLGVAQLLAAEDSPRTRKVSADILQSLIFAFYPAESDLMSALREKIDELGGSTLRPKGGRIFRFVTACLGWRTSLAVRRTLERRGRVRPISRQ